MLTKLLFKLALLNNDNNEDWLLAYHVLVTLHILTYSVHRKLTREMRFLSPFYRVKMETCELNVLVKIIQLACINSQNSNLRSLDSGSLHSLTFHVHIQSQSGPYHTDLAILMSEQSESFHVGSKKELTFVTLCIHVPTL